MLLIIITILIILLGISSLIIASKKNYYDGEIWGMIGTSLLAIGILALIVQSISLMTKPINYKYFKADYDATKEIVTSKDDIRDAKFTEQILYINKKIKSCNEFKDSKWIGIFYHKSICKMELIKK